MASHRIHMLLDRSGSMGSYRQQTIEAVNAYLATLRADELARDTSFTLTTFDSESIDTVRRDERGASVRDLSPREFVPRSATPLYDAVGYVLDLESRVRVTGRRAVVIVTDGAENGSRRLNEATIRARVEAQEAQGWIFIFLGANQNAAVEAAKVGVPEQRAISYRAGSGKAAAATFAAAAALSFGYFMLKPGYASAAAATGFTEADRQAAFDGAADWEAEMMKDMDGAPSEPPAGPDAAAVSGDGGLASSDGSLSDSEAQSDGAFQRGPGDHAADVGADTGSDLGNNLGSDVADAADGASSGSFFGSIASAIGSIFSAVTGGDSDAGSDGGGWDSGGDSGGGDGGGGD